MIVYKITNKVNGKVYIGQTTKTVEARWKSHCKPSRRINLLTAATIKYGRNNFSIETLGTYTSYADLNTAEEYFISWHNSLSPQGYNLMPGGNNCARTEETRSKLSRASKGRRSRLGAKLSDETKAKISAANKLAWSGPGIRQKAREGRLGKSMSPEARAKLSLAHKGRVWTPEHRAKQHAAQFGRKVSDATKKKMSNAHKGKIPWNKK